jgi:hypothetical protein
MTQPVGPQPFVLSFVQYAYFPKYNSGITDLVNQWLRDSSGELVRCNANN